MKKISDFNYFRESNRTTAREELDKAIKFFGSGYKLAEALGVSRYVIHCWMNEKKEMRVRYAREIQRLSRGQVKARKLLGL